MKALNRIVMVVSLLAASTMASVGTASAAPRTWYVSAAAIAPGDGTAASPFTDPQNAFDAMRPGDTVRIGPGIYDVDWDGFHIVNKGGIATARFTVIGVGTPLLRDPDQRIGAWNAMLDIQRSSFVTVQGLSLQGSRLFGIRIVESNDITIQRNRIADTGGSAVYATVDYYNTGIVWNQRITVRANEMTNWCKRGAYGSGAGCQEGISIGQTNGFVVADNLMHDAYQLEAEVPTPGGGEAIDAKAGVQNGRIIRNTIWNTNQLGIYIDGWDSFARNITISRNVVHHTGNGIAVNTETGGVAENIRIIDNLVYETGMMGISINQGSPPGSQRNILIANNTLWRNGFKENKPNWAPTDSWGSGIDVPSTVASGITIANNITASNATNQLYPPRSPSRITGNAFFDVFASDQLGENPIVGDPMFVNPAAGDFRLQAGSPASGKGVRF